MDPAVRGGLSGSFRGETLGKPAKPDLATQGSVAQFAASLTGGQDQQANQFQGLGPLLEEDDATVFDTVDGLVLRQEILALNHLAMDTHWTYVKMGYPWSTLVKEPGRDVWKQSLDYGSTISIQAVPNKAWDQINKTTEALLVDFPQVDCEPQDDTEDAEAVCDIAERFLTQNAGEQGTNDAQLVWDRLQRSLTCASAYVEVWTDPTGGGYVPLAIPAHPQAQSPMQPLLGPDGNPTDSPVMRYVTSVGPDGQPTPESQFTDDPTQAAPQWEPELRISKWQREHVRVFPETVPVEKAEKVVILGYCTLGEAKRRWPSVAQMSPEDLSRLCDWQPRRYLALLPFFQRGRWKLTDGRDKNKQGSSDERIMFYYHVFAIASPDHRKGADVVVTGALNKLVIDRKTLSVEIERDVAPEDNPQEQQQPGVVGSINPQGPVTRKETRCMEIPVAQLTPRGDPDDQDPSGRAYIELIAGAVESNAHLALSAAEIIDKNLHLEGYSSATSPVLGVQRENARASGDLIPLIRPEDKPVWGTPIPFEQAFFNFYNLSDQAINSMGSTERAAKGQPSDEKSGRAIQLATANNNVSLSGMNNAVNAFYTRLSRLKLERMMADYTTQQKIAYVGDDGIFKEEDFNALDFALVGNISIKAGTGGLVTPDQKIQNLGGLVQMNMLTASEAQEAARPAFSQKLGLGADPAEQRIERQITAFNKGPPQGLEPDPNAVPDPMNPQAAQQPVDWVTRWRSYQQALQNFQQQQQAAQLAAQNAGAMASHLQSQGAPPAPQQPVRTAMLPPKMPWTPFGRLPTDTEPATATLRFRKLSRLVNSAKFESWAPEWQGVAIQEYEAMGQVVASVTPLPPLPKGVTVQAKAADPGTAAQEEMAVEHPSQAPPPKPPPVMPIPTQPARPPLAATPASHPVAPVHPATAGVTPPVHSPLANLGAH